jgi:hypothetical protein
LKVDQVKPAILQGAAVGFDFSEDKGIKRAPIFRADLNNHLVLSVAFLVAVTLAGSGLMIEHDAQTCRLQQTPNYFLTPKIASLAAFAT